MIPPNLTFQCETIAMIQSIITKFDLLQCRQIYVMDSFLRKYPSIQRIHIQRTHRTDS